VVRALMVCVGGPCVCRCLCVLGVCFGGISGVCMWCSGVLVCVRVCAYFTLIAALYFATILSVTSLTRICIFSVKLGTFPMIEEKPKPTESSAADISGNIFVIWIVILMILV